MPGNSTSNLDPTGTDEHTDDTALDGDETSPFKDPLSAMFGAEEEEEGDAENADAEDEDEDPDADAEEETEDEEEEPEEESDSESDNNEDEDEEQETDDEAESDKEEAEDGDGTDKKWKEQLKKLPPEAQKIVIGQRKALVKLREKRNKLKEEVTTLTSERDDFKAQAEAKQAQPIRIESNTEPLGHLVTEEEVNDYMGLAEQTIEWCEDNADGGEAPDGKGGKRELSKEEVRDIKRNAEKVLSRHGPRRIEFLNTYAKKTEEARTAYPQLFKAGEERKQAEALVKEHPELLRIPGHMTLIGDMLIGQQVREKKLVTVKAGKKTSEAPPEKKKPKNPVAAPASSSAPAARPQPKSKDKGSSQLRADFRSGKGDPLAVFLSGSKRE